MENKAPENLDWVKELNECSIGKAFSNLRTAIEKDVKTRNSQGPPHRFEFISSPDSITVLTNQNSNLRSVVFFLREKSIYAEKDDGNKTFIVEAFLTLNDAGECKFQVKGQEVESWQLRRMALQNFFFAN